MHSINDIYDIIHEAERLETEGHFLKAYKTYLSAERAINQDDDNDCFAFAGVDIVPYEKALHYANYRRHKVWWNLSDDDKEVAND